MENTKCFICKKDIETTETGPVYLMRLQEFIVVDNTSNIRANYAIELCKECYTERIPFFEGKE